MESKDSKVNFCIKCFKGHLCIQYHNKKGWGLKCDCCNFRVSVCEGAAQVRRVDDEERRCEECNSYLLNVAYKEDSPFPGGQMAHTGCVLCDTWLRGTIQNFFSRQAARLMTDAEIEESNRLKEERKRAKQQQNEDKKKLNADS